MKVDFDSGHFVEVPNKDGWDFATNLTVEAWVYFPVEFRNPDPNHYSWMAVALRGPDGNTGFNLGQKGKFYVFQLKDGAGLTHDAPILYHATFGAWSHIAGTWDGQTARIHVDGRSYGQQRVVTSPIIPKSQFPLLIGKEGLPGAENPWPGKIDEVRLWNRTLTPEEIRNGRHQRLRGDEPGLVGYWNFDQGDGRDASVNGNHGVVRGVPRFVEVPAPIPHVLRPGPLLSGWTFAFKNVVEKPQDYFHVFEASADLRQWETLETDHHFETNRNGEVMFVDDGRNAGPIRFYRIRLNSPPP